MGFWNRPLGTPSPHPIGELPDDVHRALEDLEAVRLEQRRAELEHAGATVKRIIACRPEATLFINAIGRAMTGWRWRWPTGRLEVRYESGFRESPSEWATPHAEGDDGVTLATGDDLRQ